MTRDDRTPALAQRVSSSGLVRSVTIASTSVSGQMVAKSMTPTLLWSVATLTFNGTGQLIRAAAEAGAHEILVAVGGSATVDGGRGALDAISEAGGLGDARILVLCDVQTPWERSAEIYGPQKGADSRMVRRLIERLDVLAGKLPRDPRRVPMTGAAGGLSGGLWAALGAELVPGAPYILERSASMNAYDERQPSSSARAESMHRA